MSILLTGGTGYIGSHTAVELIEAGMEVVLMDNLCNSEADAVDKIEQITGVRPAFFEADCCDEDAINKVFDECSTRPHPGGQYVATPINAVIHFAGLKAVGESVEKPLEYYGNNIGSTVALLKAMRAHNCHNIIFSSSATVYGSSENVPFKESEPTGGCTNPYGQTKFMIEQILQDAAKADPELSVVLLRYFNPIGAHKSGLLAEQPKGVPNNLMPYIVQVAKGIRPKLSVFGNDYPTPDGTGVRDYIHVMDLASGHKAALDYALEHKGCEVFNLGTGKGVSVLDIVAAFEKANDIKINYEIAPRRAGDIATCYADVSKAKEVLGWTAKYSIEDGCRDSYRAK
ncbi:MAG: UDP-glucose 4-epimerase GalE [Clostridia bacterium]|nr:UDP-glucose 4-epimerase GalE [Clostridia bacterium]